MTDTPPAAARPWSEWRVLRWVVLAALCGVLYGPAYLEASYATRERWGDFYQEWLSARSVRDGGRAYAPLRELAPRYTSLPPEFIATMLPWNAHPPVSVLLALPLGYLPYHTAQTVWSLVNWPLYALTVVLIVRGLRVPFHPAMVLPILVVTLACYPLFIQVQHGQLNIILMAGITAGWYLDRRGYRTGAGLAVGFAAAVKLVPAFLFLYFLAARRWRSLAVAVVTFVGLHALALGVLGLDDVRVYRDTVIPSVTAYVSSRHNISLPAFWLRLFDPHPNEGIDALFVAPWLAVLMSALSRLAVIAVTAWRAYAAQTPFEHERAYATAVVGILLVSPICWDHYFLLAAFPAFFAWRYVRGIGPRVVFWLVFLQLLLPKYYVPQLVYGVKDGAQKYLFGTYQVSAAENLCLASLLNYVLVALFVLVVAAPEPAAAGREPPAAGNSPSSR